MKEKIEFIGRDIPWEEISNKLRNAVANEHKIFQGQQIKSTQNEIHKQNKLIRQKPKGQGRKLQFLIT